MTTLPGGDRMAGKAAIVVGGGQAPGTTIGNGRATALLLARHGAEVLVVDRDLERAADTCAQVAAHGGVAHPHAADITDLDQCRSLAAAALDRWGRIDAVVNNVGIGAHDGTTTSLAPEGFDLIHAVNLKGPWQVARSVIPAMEEAGGGAIVNVSSLASIAASPLLAYKTSKAALNALTEYLAITHAKAGVRVNAVLPGLIDTPMAIEGVASAFGLDRDELRANRDRMVPLRRKQGTAWDVAHAVLFLASDEARFISGALLPVDGAQGLRIG